MIRLLKTPVRVAGTLFAAALFAVAQGAVARPGTVNYTEGNVTIDGQSIGSKALGQTEMAPGQTIETAQNGKAEVLLTPGVFVRLNGDSAMRMVSPSLTNTDVKLVRGEALVEVDQIAKENHLAVTDRGAQVQLEKKGLYEFNANQPVVAVYDGKAVAVMNDRSVDVGKGKELMLTAASKPQKFDRDQGDDLYAWSNLRSQYMAEANLASAQLVVNNYGSGWWGGPGWFWNPWYSTWAFMPGGDAFLYSPFGYGFYSPVYVYNYRPFAYRYGARVGAVPGGRFVPGGQVVSPGAAIARPAPSFRGGAPMMHTAPAVGGGGMRFGGRR